MCGIFGAVLGDGSPLLGDAGLAHVEQLFRLSASRGKEAAGLAVAGPESLWVYKLPLPAGKLIARPELRRLLRDELRADTGGAGLAFIGHSRLVTDGGRDDNANNQPVVGDGIVGIHNGIIVNHEALWAAHRELVRRHQVDSEVIFALLRLQLQRGLPLAAACAATFAMLRGAASIAALFADRDRLLLATNNGSLYLHARPDAGTVVFASERFILDRFLRRSALGPGPVEAVAPGHGAIVDLAGLAIERFAFADPAPAGAEPVRARPRRIEARSPALPPPARAADPAARIAAIEQRFPYRSTDPALRRCTRCVLPHTMPFIQFDADGVCSYCRNYRRRPLQGRAALEALVARHRHREGRPDCVVGVSGGRDSMYGLHYLKNELGLNPVAFTYDWGMVTDLARRNVSRICGQLGVEHILVSADIDRKRSHIRKNVEAWLRRPALGTIPLFMAGDKAYFHHLERVRRQVDAPLAFLCENPLERTDFKSGFAGVPPVIDDDVWVAMITPRGRLQMVGYYLRQFARNPAYLNSSLLDSALAFVYYYHSRDYLNLYSFVPWREDQVVRTLIDDYQFELAGDTESTWRIGDGTAAFYNYIYHTVAGFTEHEALRSNQIREGFLDRDSALRMIERESRPRMASIHWYLETALGMTGSLERVIETIQAIPKLYDVTRTAAAASAPAPGTAAQRAPAR